jgi:hypothetical protein
MLPSQLGTDEDEIRGPHHSRPIALIPGRLRPSPKSVISRKITIIMENPSTSTERRREELREEYFKVIDIFQGYDPYFLSIKNWGVTADAT